MITTPAEYEALHRAEYAWLCRKLGLHPVAVIFKHTSDDEPEDPRYGGTPRQIYLPYASGDLEVPTTSPTPDDGPPTWTINSAEGRAYWVRWRTDLWHEVTHQLQDQVLRKWNSKDGDGGHAEGWDDALAEVSRLLGDQGAVLKDYLAVDVLAVAMARATIAGT